MLWRITVAWLFGSIWLGATSGAPFTIFADRLRPSPFVFGLLSAMPFLASLLSLPASWVIEATGRRRGIFLLTSTASRLSWILIGLVPYWWWMNAPAQMKHHALAIFLCLVFAMYALASIGTPAWMSWMADLVPERVRGRYFARRRAWGMLTSIPAAILTGWLMDRFLQGQAGERALMVCAIIFAIAGVIGAVDIFCFFEVPEPVRQPQRGVQLLRSLARPLADRNFLWFAASTGMLVFGVSFMGQFVTLYLVERVGLRSVGIQMMVLIAPMIAQLLVLPAWGLAAERIGKKPSMALAAAGLVPIGLGWCLLDHGDAWLGYVLTFLGAAFFTGVEIVNFNLVCEMSAGSQDNTGGSSYIAVNTIIINVAGCIGGLASGVIAASLGAWQWTPWIGHHTFSYYDVLFVLSALFRLLSLAMIPFIHEPAAGKPSAALRLMGVNIYNNVSHVMMQPLRLIAQTRPAGDRESPVGEEYRGQG